MAHLIRQMAVALLVLMALVRAEPARASVDKEAAYQAARQDFLDLVKDEKRKKYRDQWKRITSQLDRSVEQLPRGQRQCEALFNAGRAWYELAAISYLHFDRKEGSQRFRTLVERCPASSLADDSLFHSAELWVRMDPEESRRDLERLLKSYPGGDMVPRARALLTELPPAKAKSEAPPPVAAAKPAAAASSASKNTPASTPEAATKASQVERSAVAPRQATVDAAQSQAGAVGSPAAPIAEARPAPVAPNAPQSSAQAPAGAQPASPPATPAVVAAKGEGVEASAGIALPSAVDILAALDARGADAERPEDVALATDIAKDRELQAQPAPEAKAPDRERMEAIREAVGGEIPLSLAAGLKVKRVVIDPGHGGKDTGAIAKDGTKEKDLTLAIAQKLKKRLAALGLEVFLTRETDVFLSLEERTRFANEKHGDLFISVHINAATNRSAHGIETYTLNLNSDRYAMRLAARENATSERSIGDLDLILADLATKANTDDSVRLARLTQDRLVTRLRSRYKAAPIRDLGVKQALFFVLVGAKMPAILVESGFISNPDEAKRLRAGDYQDEIASSISDGVRRFIEEREAIARGELPGAATVF